MGKIKSFRSLIWNKCNNSFLSALSGYFLAGRTLRPIKNMLDEQNRFITDASHELNTPLTALKTSLEVNLRNKQLNLEEAREVLKSNLEDVNNLQSLSEELIK
jgi:signal transduction histidine kinase